MDYVKSIVRKYAKNAAIVEELTQEIFLRAYRSYDQYIEQGKIRHWLAIISENKLKKEYRSKQKYYDIDNSHDIDSEFFRNTLAAPQSDNPEDVVINNEQMAQIMSIISRLPKKQKDVIMYRYVYDYSVKEVEQIMGITSSNVKVTTHSALKTVREKLGVEETNQNKTNTHKPKGENIMKFDKKTAYSYLYQYAKYQISTENKAAVEEYIKTDEEAADIAEALKELHSQLVLGKDGENTYYYIKFQLENGDKVTYANLGSHDEGENWQIGFSMGYDTLERANQRLNTFDNEGDIIKFERTAHEDGIIVDHVKIKNPQYSPVYWMCTVYYNPNVKVFEKSKDSPNLYKIAETFDSSSFSEEYRKEMKYIALPKEATNIRVKRGNGVIECGKHKFAYADRYIVQDEMLALDVTFNM